MSRVETTVKGPLSPQEIRVVQLLCGKDMTKEGAAAVLKVKPNTVISYVKRIHSKTETHCVSALTRWAIRERIIGIDGFVLMPLHEELS